VRQVTRQLLPEDETILPAPDVAEFTLLQLPGTAHIFIVCSVESIGFICSDHRIAQVGTDFMQSVVEASGLP
jgi:hypothetical protein